MYYVHKKFVYPMHMLEAYLFIIFGFTSQLFEVPPLCVTDLDFFLVYVVFNSQGHIAMCSLRVEESVHTSRSRFCKLLGIGK